MYIKYLLVRNNLLVAAVECLLSNCTLHGHSMLCQWSHVCLFVCPYFVDHHLWHMSSKKVCITFNELYAVLYGMTREDHLLPICQQSSCLLLSTCNKIILLDLLLKVLSYYLHILSFETFIFCLSYIVWIRECLFKDHLCHRSNTSVIRQKKVT